ncbi:hypothetical protein NUM3379_13790 [Kineococcus sp. NUM-3379]
MRIRTVLMGAGLAIALVPASAGTAQAATVHFTEPEYCEHDDDGVGAICFHTEGQLNRIVTPSGNISYRSAGITYYEYQDPGLLHYATEELSYTYHWLRQRSKEQVEHYRMSRTVIAGSRTCVSTRHFHATRERLAFDRTTVNCTEA